jgi:hypothetical protein
LRKALELNPRNSNAATNLTYCGEKVSGN